MTPARQLLEDICTQAGVITTTKLGAAMSVRLIKSPFTPAKDMPPLVAGDEANFNTYLGIDIIAAARLKTYDPATDELLLFIPPPAGGWHWKTGSTANLPQTIYGWAATTTLGAVPLAGSDIIMADLFTTPIVLTAALQEVNVDEVLVRFKLGGIG